MLPHKSYLDFCSTDFLTGSNQEFGYLEDYKLYLILFGFIFLISSVLIGGLSSEAGQNEKSSGCQDCNVLIISVDLLRPDHMGAYGYERNTTPNMDALADRSTVFTNVYSQESFTLPSVTSVFTSVYPSQHNVTTDTVTGLPKDFVTFPEVFERKGYNTYGVFDPSDLRPGYGLYQGFNQTSLSDNFERDMKIIREDLNDTEGEKFFMYYHDFTLHSPTIPPKKYSEMFNGTNETLREDVKEKWESVKPYHTLRNFDEWRKWYYIDKIKGNPDNYRHLISEYDGQVRHVDHNIGKLLEILRRRGLMNNTIVVITANHGTGFGEHKAFREGTLHREGINVPFIVYLPDRKQEGEKRKQYLELLDLGPTILDLVDIKSENYRKQSEGISLKPLFNGGRINKSYVMSENQRGTVMLIDIERKMKIINKIGGHTPVYNLTRDPWEREPVNDTEEIEHMHNKLRQFYLSKTGKDPFEIETGKTFPYFAEN